MFKLIRADFFRLFHRAYVYVLLGGLAGLSILINVTLMHSEDYASAVFSWELLLNYLMFPMMLLPMLTDVVFGEEFKEHTLKNTVAHGANRVELYLAKLISSELLGLLLAAVTAGVYCGSSLLFLHRDAQFTEQFVREFFERFGAACVLYMAGVALAVLLTALFRKSSLSLFAYYGVVFLLRYLFSLLRVSVLNKYLLITQFSAVAGGPMQEVQTAVVIGAVSFAVFAVAGPVLFLRQDVD